MHLMNEEMIHILSQEPSYINDIDKKNSKELGQGEGKQF